MTTNKKSRWSLLFAACRMWRSRGRALAAARSSGSGIAAGQWTSRFLVPCLIVCTVLLGGCSSGPAWVNHAFGFDVGIDSPGYEVLAYRYGQGKFHTTSSDNAIRRFGRSHQATGINGSMPLGDNLYVKWRNRVTDEVFEKSIELKPLLPKEMTRQRIHFVVAEAVLFVYLIDPAPRPADWPVVGPRKFQFEKVRQIHP